MTLSEVILSGEQEVDSHQEIADLHMYRLALLQEEHLRGYYK